MPTKKEIKKYKEKYYDIPKDLNDRLIFLINKLNLKHIITLNGLV